MAPQTHRARPRAVFAASVAAVVVACSSSGNAPTASTPASPSTPTTTTTTGSTTTVTIKANPCGVSGTVQLAVGAVQTFDCSGGGTTVTLAGAGASYFVLTQFAGNTAPFAFVPYWARAGTPAATTVALRAGAVRRALLGAPAGGGASGLPLMRPRAAQVAADRALRSRALQLVRSGSITQGSARLRAARLAADIAATPAAGSMRAFHVANSFSVSSYATIGARLAYAGANVLLYVDTLAPTGFTADQLQAYGTLVDQTLYPLATSTFGTPSDVDNNGHFIMVMSPVVNALVTKASCVAQGYVGGFFDPNDFAASNANSNGGEIFYSIVPDPNAQFSCTHTVANVGEDVPGIFLHELQHLINFSQHAILRSGAPLDSWLDEGMSIVAEELGSLYYEKKCPPPSCRTNPSQLFPDSSQGYVSGFLYDSYQYALLPDTASILLSDDSSDGFAWRGGAWLLTRYLADQFGDRVLRALETGPGDGVAAIAAATGLPFGPTFANFGIALYTDSLPGLPRSTAPAINRFVSRNVRALWARLFATSASSSVPTASPLYLAPLTADSSALIMYPGTMSYWRLDTPASSTAVTVQFAAPSNGAFSPALKSQIVVFRLPTGQ